MSTTQLLKEINQLPAKRREDLANRILRSINKENEKKLERAVSEMAIEYKNNPELTVMTNLDFENFYEAR